MLLKPEQDAIHQAGVEAAHAGATREDCPHPLGAQSRAVWLEGYDNTRPGGCASQEPEVEGWYGS